MVSPGTPAPPTPPTRPSAPVATPIPPSATQAPGPSGESSQWPVQATDTIVNLVDQVRDKTTGPILTAARGAVFGILAAILGLIVVILLLIFAVRLLDNALPGGVWLPYLILGVVFTTAGALVFSRRNRGATGSTV